MSAVNRGPGYRLSPNEEADILKEEQNRRRKLRLKQVREQDRLFAKQLLVKAKAKKEAEVKALSARLEEEWEAVQQEKEEALQGLYDRCIASIGQGHRSAKEQKPVEQERALAAKKNTKAAQQRHQVALQRESAERNEKWEKENAHILARKSALDVERVRASYIAGLPPKRDPLADLDLPLPPVQVVRVEGFATTHYTVPAEYAEKAGPDEQEDARLAAREEDARIQVETERLETEGRERREKASLRHKHARNQELLRQDYDHLLLELSDLQNADRRRRQAVVADIPRQVFQPPHRRLEEKAEKQHQLEEAFEDMYMKHTDYAGDITLALEPKVPDHDADLDLTTDTTVDQGSTEVTLERPAGLVAGPAQVHVGSRPAESGQKPASTRADMLKKLMGRVRGQQDDWRKQQTKLPTAVASDHPVAPKSPRQQDVSSSITTESFAESQQTDQPPSSTPPTDISEHPIESRSSRKGSSVPSLETGSLSNGSVIVPGNTLLHPMERAAAIRGKQIANQRKTQEDIRAINEEQQKRLRDLQQAFYVPWDGDERPGPVGDDSDLPLVDGQNHQDGIIHGSPGLGQGSRVPGQEGYLPREEPEILGNQQQQRHHEQHQWLQEQWQQHQYHQQQLQMQQQPSFAPPLHTSPQDGRATKHSQDDRQDFSVDPNVEVHRSPGKDSRQLRPSDIQGLPTGSTQAGSPGVPAYIQQTQSGDVQHDLTIHSQLSGEGPTVDWLQRARAYQQRLLERQKQSQDSLGRAQASLQERRERLMRNYPNANLPSYEPYLPPGSLDSTSHPLHVSGHTADSQIGNLPSFTSQHPPVSQERLDFSSHVPEPLPDSRQQLSHPYVMNADGAERNFMPGLQDIHEARMPHIPDDDSVDEHHIEEDIHIHTLQRNITSLGDERRVYESTHYRADDQPSMSRRGLQYGDDDSVQEQDPHDSDFVPMAEETASQNSTSEYGSTTIDTLEEVRDIQDAVADRSLRSEQVQSTDELASESERVLQKRHLQLMEEKRRLEKRQREQQARLLQKQHELSLQIKRQQERYQQKVTVTQQQSPSLAYRDRGPAIEHSPSIPLGVLSGSPGAHERQELHSSHESHLSGGSDLQPNIQGLLQLGHVFRPEDLLPHLQRGSGTMQSEEEVGTGSSFQSSQGSERNSGQLGDAMMKGLMQGHVFRPEDLRPHLQQGSETMRSEGEAGTGSSFHSSHGSERDSGQLGDAMMGVLRPHQLLPHLQMQGNVISPFTLSGSLPRGEMQDRYLEGVDSTDEASHDFSEGPLGMDSTAERYLGAGHSHEQVFSGYTGSPLGHSNHEGTQDISEGTLDSTTGADTLASFSGSDRLGRVLQHSDLLSQLKQIHGEANVDSYLHDNEQYQIESGQLRLSRESGELHVVSSGEIHSRGFEHSGSREYSSSSSRQGHMGVYQDMLQAQVFRPEDLLPHLQGFSQDADTFSRSPNQGPSLSSTTNQMDFPANFFTQSFPRPEGDGGVVDQIQQPFSGLSLKGDDEIQAASPDFSHQDDLWTSAPGVSGHPTPQAPQVVRSRRPPPANVNQMGMLEEHQAPHELSTILEVETSTDERMHQVSTGFQTSTSESGSSAASLSRPSALGKRMPPFGGPATTSDPQSRYYTTEEDLSETTRSGIQGMFAQEEGRVIQISRPAVVSTFDFDAEASPYMELGADLDRSKASVASLGTADSSQFLPMRLEADSTLTTTQDSSLHLTSGQFRSPQADRYAGTDYRSPQDARGPHQQHLDRPSSASRSSSKQSAAIGAVGGVSSTRTSDDNSPLFTPPSPQHQDFHFPPGPVNRQGRQAPGQGDPEGPLRPRQPQEEYLRNMLISLQAGRQKGITMPLFSDVSLSGFSLSHEGSLTETRTPVRTSEQASLEPSLQEDTGSIASLGPEQTYPSFSDIQMETGIMEEPDMTFHTTFDTTADSSVHPSSDLRPFEREMMAGATQKVQQPPRLSLDASQSSEASVDPSLLSFQRHEHELSEGSPRLMMVPETNLSKESSGGEHGSSEWSEDEGIDERLELDPRQTVSEGFMEPQTTALTGTMSLQDAFQQRKQGFLQASQKRKEEVKVRAESRSQEATAFVKTLQDWKRSKVKSQKKKTSSTGASTKKSGGSMSASSGGLGSTLATPTDRDAVQKEMRERNLRLYSKLEEVQRRKAEEQRKEVYATNRQKKKEFEEKLLKARRAKGKGTSSKSRTKSK